MRREIEMNKQATRKQISYIKYLAEEKGIDFSDLNLYAIKKWKASIENWQFSSEAASDLIDELQSGTLNLGA